MRRIHWKSLGKVVAGLLVVLFLNYNSALGRYDDQIGSCEFSKENSQRPQRDSWYAARSRALDAWHKLDHGADDSVNLYAANVYLRTVKGLDRSISTPCVARFDRPRFLGI